MVSPQSSFSNDARVVALLQQILSAIEALTISIQESNRNMQNSFSPSQFPSLAGTFMPPPPSQASNLSGGEVYESSLSTAALSAAFATGVSVQPNGPAGGSTGRYQFVPAELRWYCVFRGRQVGPIQGWDNVQAVTDGLDEARYQRFSSREDAHVAFRQALMKSKQVRLL
ncbi:hypothetical protein JOM56_001589 [Amanita muscaria]|uniref:Ribonuclease H1 N-terminal domain-containing protein n=1 Tax=Amanita muscaria (strain Koide BX008) TaxID=946122 RepID=A0A0C2RZP2_AMAMK|nr:hypothetical protein M378DRAFT_182124 [Amanita muscaria Koide BX008]